MMLFIIDIPAVLCFELFCWRRGDVATLPVTYYLLRLPSSGHVRRAAW